MEKLEGCCVPQTCCQLPPSVVHVHHVPFSLFFFSLITEEKQTFFLDMGDLKRDQSSMFRFYLSVFIYMIHFFFLLAGVSSRLHVLAVPSLIMCVLLTPVLLSCKIVALLFQSGRLCQVVITLHTWVYYLHNLLF